MGKLTVDTMMAWKIFAYAAYNRRACNSNVSTHFDTFWLLTFLVSSLKILSGLCHCSRFVNFDYKYPLSMLAFIDTCGEIVLKWIQMASISAHQPASCFPISMLTSYCYRSNKIRTKNNCLTHIKLNKSRLFPCCSQMRIDASENINKSQATTKLFSKLIEMVDA